MAVFTYRGRRGGAVSQGRDRGGRPTRAPSAALRAQGRRRHVRSQRRRTAQARRHQEDRRQGQGQGHGDLHPPVLHDDRRRPAARAVPRHPRRAERLEEPARRHRARSRATVEEGSTFAEALRKHPKVFDDLYANLVQVGEAGGILDNVLQRLAVLHREGRQAQAQGQGRMVYPVTIISVAVLVIVFMLIFVIPTFAKMFKDSAPSCRCPPDRHRALGLRAAATSWLIGRRGRRHRVGAPALLQHRAGPLRPSTRFLLKVPVFGMLIRKVAVARFTRTLGTLDLVRRARSSRRSHHRDARPATGSSRGPSLQCRTAVTEGKTLAEPLKSTTSSRPWSCR